MKSAFEPIQLHFTIVGMWLQEVVVPLGVLSNWLSNLPLQNACRAWKTSGHPFWSSIPFLVCLESAGLVLTRPSNLNVKTSCSLGDPKTAKCCLSIDPLLCSAYPWTFSMACLPSLPQRPIVSQWFLFISPKMTHFSSYFLPWLHSKSCAVPSDCNSHLWSLWAIWWAPDLQ